MGEVVGSIPAGGVRGEATGGAGEPAGVQRGDGVGDARGRAGVGAGERGGDARRVVVRVGEGGGRGWGEDRRGGRARRGAATGEGPTIGADGRDVVVVVVVVGEVVVVVRRGVLVRGSGAGGEVPRDDLGRASLLAGHGLGRRALERGERGGVVELGGRARRGRGRERDGIDAREGRGRRRVSRGSLGEENGQLRIAGSIAVVVARVDGGDRVPGLQEQRLAVATDGVAHHREARGRLGRVGAHLAGAAGGVTHEERPFDFSLWAPVCRTGSVVESSLARGRSKRCKSCPNFEF